MAQNGIFDSIILKPVAAALGFTDEQIGELRQMIATGFGTPKDKQDLLNFLIIYYLADAIVARQFEGLPLKYDFNEREQFLV